MLTVLVTYHYFLGLRTLTVIQNAISLIKQNYNITIDIDTLSFDDEKVYEIIGQGKTDGVFQLESSGMKSFMKELKPESLEDIIAGISLYRPGPMDFIPKYVKGKNNPQAIEYTTKELEPILKTTYSCIVYQEQVMQIVRDLAGYTLGRSDLVRRAMSKKKGDVMEKERSNFIYGNKEENIPGCINNGIEEKAAAKIFDEMTDFAKYAFNKSHAACYGVIAYQTGYLKAHYPVEFMAALMTSVMDHSEKVAEYIGVCKTMGIQIIPPDINKGIGTFSVYQGKILYGLAAIKSVGRNPINTMIKERKAKGPFKDMTDFCERMESKDMNKRMIEGLIKAGAFDAFGGTRKQYMAVYKTILDAVAQTRKRILEGQVNLFDMMGNSQSVQYQIPDLEEYPEEIKLAMEKEVLGVYLTGHPLAKYESLWIKNTSAKTTDFYKAEEEKTSQVYDGQKVIVGGMIIDKSVKTTRNNQMMAFITLEDFYGTVEVIIFPKDYEKYRSYIEEDAIVFIIGRAAVQEDENGKIICQYMVQFEQLDETKEKVLWLKLSDQNQFNKVKNNIAQLLKASPGNTPVKIYLEKEKKTMTTGKGLWISPNIALLQQLYTLIESNGEVRLIVNN